MKSLCLLLLLGALLPIAPLRALEFHVSPAGSDTAPGTAAAPFATITRARNAIRALKEGGSLPDGEIKVWLHGGYYNQSATLRFDRGDSGRAEQPIIYAGWPGDEVYITGARSLDPAWFSLVTNSAAVWSRVDPRARGQIYAVDLKLHGITDFGALNLRGYGMQASGPLALLANGRPARLARWPNIDDPAGPFSRTITTGSGTEITYRGVRPERWENATDVWLHGFWGMSWADFHLPLARVNPASKALVLGKPPAQFGIAPNHPYYVYNLIEELDQPGEYYLDRASGVLYYWPLTPLAETSFQVTLLDASLILMSGAQYVTWRDVVIEASRSSLLDVQSGGHVRVERCLFRNAGTYGVHILGVESGLDQCEIVDCGDDGVQIGGGVRASLTPGNNYVTNSRIHRTGRTGWTGKPGVSIAGCGNRVAHNTLDDMPHGAITFVGNNHVIEFNEIQRVCRVTSDAGAIYSGRDWGYRGNIIRYNFIHDIQTSLGAGVSGVYLDDCVSGVEVFGNIFYRIANTAVECGGGRDNIITNNIIAECGLAHFNDERGRRLITSTPGDSFNLRERLSAEGINHQSPVWKAAYPAAADIPNSWAALKDSMWLNPENCVFSTNAGWSNKSWTVETNTSSTGVFGVYASLTNNNPEQSPLFHADVLENRVKRPVTIASDLKGFQPIPLRAIGPALAASRTAHSAPPPAPSLERASTAADQVHLQWSFRGRSHDVGVTQYDIERRNLPDGAWTTLRSVGAEIDFSGITGLAAHTGYEFRVRATNPAGSTPSNVVALFTAVHGLVAGTPIRIEAEAPLTVLSDVGTNGGVGVNNAILDSGSSVCLFDPGDAVRVNFSVPTPGTYRLGVRGRAGIPFWPGGYVYKLDGAIILLLGDPATLSAMESSYGPTVWGTMFSDTLTLQAGAHHVDITSSADWGVVDYVEITPLSPPPTEAWPDWQREHFAADQLANPEVSDRSAIPVNDGINNLLKYALGLDPWVRVSQPNTLMSLEAGKPLLTFRRPAGRTDVNYLVERSDDSQTWTVVPQVNPGKMEAREYTQVEFTAAAPRFVRLRVESGGASASTPALPFGSRQ